MNFSRNIARLFRGVPFDIWGVASAFLVLIFLQKDLWITGERILTHDSLKWYPIFAYFADCLQQGQLPLWNPYMHCGEPFFPNIAILHLWDPATLFLVLWGKIFHVATFVLYRYDLLIRYLIFCAGGYVFFRSVARHRASAFFAFLVLTFSSLSVSYLRQHAFILSWYLFPWMAFFLIDFLERHRGISLIALVFCLALTLSSYHGMFTIMACLLFLISFLTGGRMKLLAVKIKWPTCLIACLLFAMLVLMVIPLSLIYTHDLVATVRMTQAKEAAFSYPADFLLLLAPYAFILHFFNWYYLSESFVYIGLLPFLFFLTGVIFSGHKYKKAFLIVIFFLSLLMLGDLSFIYPLFLKIFPFFSIIRNMHTFGPLLIFLLVYFVCLGIDEFIERKAFSDAPRHFFFLGVFVAAGASAVKLYFDQSWVKVMGVLHILQEVLSVVTKGHLLLILDTLSYLDFNIIFFLCACLLLYFLVRRGRIPFKFLPAGLVFVAMLDLMLFQLTAYQMVTAPAAAVDIPKSGAGISWNEKRHFDFSSSFRFGLLPLWQRQFVARSASGKFAGEFSFLLPAGKAMQEVFFIFDAMSPTHFFQTRTFFDFETNTRIPDTVKQDVMGVSSLRLRFFHSAVILPREEIVEVLQSSDPQALTERIFIEKESSMGPEFFSATQGELRRSKAADAWRVSAFGPNHLEVEVRSASGGFLYYADTFDKNWKAYVDGKQRRLDKANLAFKAVFVEEGRHSVRFVYDPVLYRAALWCYFCGLLAFPFALSLKILRRQ